MENIESVQYRVVGVHHFLFVIMFQFQFLFVFYILNVITDFSSIYLSKHSIIYYIGSHNTM